MSVIDQRPALHVGWPLAQAVPFRPEEIGQGEHRTGVSPLDGTPCQIPRLPTLLRLGPALAQERGRIGVPAGQVIDHDVGYLVAGGLDRQAALAAVTLEAAHVLGVGDRLGSLEPGKDANLVLWDGDPFEPQSRIQAVMLEGEFVSGEVGR